VHGLRVLSKTHWRRLRNKYLNDQRKNMSAAKALLHKRKLLATEISLTVKPSRKPLETAVDKSSTTDCSHQSAESNAEESLTFTPGLIVQFTIEAGKV
jgi:hypothetical protein